MIIYTDTQTQTSIQVRVGREVRRPPRAPGTAVSAVGTATEQAVDVAIPVGDSERVDSDSDDISMTGSTTDQADEATREINQRLRAAKTLIHSFISGANPPWKVDGNRWLRYPTTSKIPHDTTHPAFLRTLRIDPSGLDGFQTTINSAGEFDIYDDLNTVTGNGAFLIDWDAFFTQPGETVERDVQTSLVQVIESIGRALGIRVRAKLDEPMAVGGILALHELDIHGNTDIVIYNNDNDPLLAIEVKTPRTFDGDRWYRDSRATQILTPLYHFNVPTFLATQEQFKLCEHATHDMTNRLSSKPANAGPCTTCRW